MGKKLVFLMVLLASASVLAQDLRSNRLPQPPYPQQVFSKENLTFEPVSNQNNQDGKVTTSLWAELGYILAMETTFLGMSYLASRKNRVGPAITGGFDVFMGTAGLLGMSEKTDAIQIIGYALLSAGFFAKAFYNFQLNKQHQSNTRFWTNFVGFNILVFSGYYLDSL